MRGRRWCSPWSSRHLGVRNGGPGDHAEHLQGEGAQAGVALPRAVALLARAEVLVAAVGAVEGDPPRRPDAAHRTASSSRLPTSPRSAASSARATQSAKDSESSRWSRKALTTLVT